MTLKKFEYTKIIGEENIEFGNNVIIDDFVLIYAKCKMKFGNFIHIGSFSTIVGVEYFEVNDFCAISHGCRVLTATDDFKSWGFGNSTINVKYRNIKRAPVILEKFSIIGVNSIILPGVTIGEGASIGAGSVITRDVSPWGVYIGNKRVAERNQTDVMNTYEAFCKENNY
jgi:galactoside O-acetyltransferase